MSERERIPELYDSTFNKVLDRFLHESKLDPDAFEALSPLQQEFIHCIDRSISRFKRKQNGLKG